LRALEWDSCFFHGAEDFFHRKHRKQSENINASRSLYGQEQSIVKSLFSRLNNGKLLCADIWSTIRGFES
jgi:hypothetical protein